MSGLPKHFDLRHLAIFIAVAETKSMVDAARRFGITQAAVSQAIVRLEHAVGRALLDRSTRPLTLTAAGAYVERQSRQVVGLATVIHQTLGDSDDFAIPELRLAAVDSFVGATMPDLLRRFHEEVKTDRILLLSGMADRNIVALSEGRVDGVMTADNLEMASGLPMRPILSERFVAVAPTDTGKTDLAGLIATHRYIGFPPSSPLGRQIQTHFGRARIALDARTTIDRPHLMLSAVADGQGWTIATPLCVAASGVAPERIRVVRIERHAGWRRVAFMTRQHELTDANLRIAQIASSVAATVLPSRLAAYAPWLPDEIALEGHDPLEAGAELE